MVLFGVVMIMAGLQSNSVVVTGTGLAIAATGLGLFAYRQVKHARDESDAGVAAGVVKISAPASLVAVVVGASLVLVGTGSLTVGDISSSGDVAGGGPATSSPPPVAPPTPEPTTTTTSTTIPPPSTYPPLPRPPDGLPHTGGGMDLALFGLMTAAGGRWLVKASQDG